MFTRSGLQHLYASWAYGAELDGVMFAHPVREHVRQGGSPFEQGLCFMQGSTATPNVEFRGIPAWCAVFPDFFPLAA